MNLQSILVATDFSEPATRAADKAAQIASRHGATVTLLHVDADIERTLELASQLDGLTGDLDKAVASRTEDLRARLGQQCENLRARGIRVDSAIVTGYPEDAICEAAETCDLLVIGTHGYTGVERVVLGSVAEKLVRRCTGDILVVRPDQSIGFDRVLVAVDFSDYTDAAVKLALQLVTEPGQIELFHCWQLTPPPATDEHWSSGWVQLRQGIAEASRARGAELVERHSRSGVKVSFVEREISARRGIQDRLGEEPFDLAVLGSHGRRGFKRWLLGSVAEMTVRHAPCSVAVAHLPNEDTSS